MATQKKKLPILQKNNKKLRKVSKRIEKITSDIKKMSCDMINCLKETNNGIGLAAPQVGENIRMVIIWTDEFKEPLVMVNPEIISSSVEEDIQQEGCLSVRGELGFVKRNKEIVVSYTTIQGSSIICSYREITARCIQHEIDHLDGILFIDKLE